MSLTVTGSNKEYKKVPEGVHRAVAVWLFDLGSQHNATYNKDEKKVLIGWQFPDERVEFDGKMQPMMMSKKYTASLGKKANLRKDLEAWRGRSFTEEELKGFDLKSILGKGCQIQVVHETYEGKQYAKIGAIMALPKGSPVVQVEGNTIAFDLSDGTAIPEGTPEWIAEIIAESPEYQNGGKESRPAAASSDDVPF